MTQQFDIEDSPLIVLHGSDGDSYKTVWAIFDVSKTVYYHYAAICWQRPNPNESSWEYPLLVRFNDVDDLLLWAAKLQVEQGAEFRSGLNCKDTDFLDALCINSWWADGWKQFIDEAIAAGKIERNFEEPKP